MTGRKIRGMIYPRTRTNVLVLAPDPLQESDIRADVFSFAPWAVPYFHRGAWGWAQPGEPPLAVQMGRAMARRLLPSACPPLAPPIRPSRGGRGRPLSVLRGRVGEPVHGPENAPGTGREVSISSLDPAFGQAPRSREKQRPSAKAAVSDKKTPEQRYLYSGLVEEGGFEPPKRNATDLQSAPFGHSGTPPYEIVELVDGFEPPTC